MVTLRPSFSPRNIAAAALLSSLLGPLVFTIVLAAAGLCGYGFFIPWMSMPVDLGSPWTVAPGSAVLGGSLCFGLSQLGLRLRPRLIWAAILGAVLAPLNVPISIQLAFVAFHFRSSRTYGWYWPYDLQQAIVHTLPVAIPCGALLGVVVGLLSVSVAVGSREQPG